MSFTVNNKTYNTAEEMFKDLQKQWEEGVPRFLRPLHRFLRNKSLADYNLWYLLTHPTFAGKRVPSYYIIQAKWFIQRGRRGYSEADVWNLYSYILSWLPEALEDLSNGISHPHEMSPEEWEHSLRKSSSELRKIRSLRSAMEDTEDDHKEFEKTWATIGKHFFQLWD